MSLQQRHVITATPCHYSNAVTLHQRHVSFLLETQLVRPLLQLSIAAL